MKAMLKIAAMASIVAAGSSSAFAAENEMVIITGNIVPVSCSVGSTTGASSTIDIGNAMATDFSAGTGIYSGLFVSSANTRTFDVGVSGCDGAVEESGSLDLLVSSAQSLPGQPNILGGGPGSTTFNAGVTLAAPATVGGENVLVKEGSTVPVYIYADGDTANKADGKTVTFTTQMASGVATPNIGHIVAPVTFSVAYK